MPKFRVKIDIDLCIVREGSTFSSLTLVKQKIRLIQRSQIFVMAILGPRRFHDIRGNMTVTSLLLCSSFV